MEKDVLLEYRRKINSLNEIEKIKRDLHLRKIALGEVYGPMVGYASVDKPWLAYYSEEHIANPIPHMTLTEYIEKQNENNLDGIALDAPDGIYTYREFFAIYHQLAAAANEIGIKKGDVCLTLLTPMALESFAIYGNNLIGAITTGVPEFSKPAEVVASINKLGVKMLYTADFLLTEEMENAIYQNTNIEHIVYLDFGANREHDDRTISWREFLAMGKDKEIPDNHVTPEDVVYISQTGGSTGEPKSVKITSNGFNIAAHQYINSNLDYNAGDKWIRLWSLFSASATVSNSHLPLSVGMHNILRNFPYDDINRYEDIILTEKANHQMVIPQILDVLERSQKINSSDLSFIKTFGCGGMAITADFEERVQNFSMLHNILTFLGYGWGCTENSTSAAMRSSFETTKVGYVGAPLVKTVVSGFDPETGEELPYGVEGELCINSYTIMDGYFNDEKLTNEVIKIHSDGSRWLHTGDLGWIDSDGLVKVTGRMTRTIFTVSEKLYPATIESTLSKVPGVREISICKIPDVNNPGFDVPICFFVPDKGFSMEDVKQNLDMACQQIYAELSRPVDYIGKDFLPLTKVGKVDTRALEQELIESLENSQVRNRVKRS